MSITNRNPFRDPRVDSSLFPKLHVTQKEKNPEQPKLRRSSYMPEALPYINHEGNVVIRFIAEPDAAMTIDRACKIHIKPELYRLLREICGKPNIDGDFYEFRLNFKKFRVMYEKDDYDTDYATGKLIKPTAPPDPNDEYRLIGEPLTNDADRDFFILKNEATLFEMGINPDNAKELGYRTVCKLYIEAAKSAYMNLVKKGLIDPTIIWNLAIKNYQNSKDDMKGDMGLMGGSIPDLYIYNGRKWVLYFSKAQIQIQDEQKDFDDLPF